MWPQLYRSYQRVKSRLFTRLVRSSFGALGSRSMLCLPIRVTGEQHIYLGDRVYIGANSWLQVVTTGVNSGASKPRGIMIGDGCSFSGFLTISCVQSVEIGNEVLIARYVYIADHSHAFDDPETPILRQGITKIAPVSIKDGAWIGQSAVICPGVTIGKNAVVGANSVVRDSVPDRCVVAGVPAKVIRRLEP